MIASNETLHNWGKLSISSSSIPPSRDVPTDICETNAPILIAVSWTNHATKVG